MLNVQLELQVYLLTPMDRATLPHAKLPLPHCMPSEITMQQLCERYLQHIPESWDMDGAPKI